jgi:hypothetical protein
VFDDDDPDAPNLVPETDPPSRVLPGQIELRQLIGEGGMGQVFLGFHMRLECDVAVKVLDPGLQLREDSRERLLREGAVLASIRHENIVQVHHCATTDDGKVFVVMELLEGETLRQLCRRVGKLDAPGGGEDRAPDLPCARAGPRGRGDPPRHHALERDGPS